MSKSKNFSVKETFDLAVKMIHLSGLIPIDNENPDGDIRIEYTGLRPGEKLYEELLIGTDVIQSEHPRIMQAIESKLDMNTDIYLRDIKDVALDNAQGLITSGVLKVGVPDCNNKEQISEVTSLLSDYFLNVSEKSCEAGMGSLITMGIDIPIINSIKDWSLKTSSTTALLTKFSKSDSSIICLEQINC